MTIKFTLLENAIDSISYGIEQLEQAIIKDNPRGYKYALLYLFQGTELLLKENLVEINPIIIFDKNSLYSNCADPAKPTIEELYNCRSIDTNGICNELKKHYPQLYNNNFRNTISLIARERNKLQHFGIETQKKDLKVNLIKLYNHVIKPSLKLIANKINNNTFNDFLSESFENIFCFVNNADNEVKMLNVSNVDFTRGCCFDCGNYSFFIRYDGESYPHSFYCTSCDYKREGIGVEYFRECPECSANSLVFDEQLGGGTCLWHKCANHRDGGVLMDMEICECCNDYRIEGKCLCNTEDE